MEKWKHIGEGERGDSSSYCWTPNWTAEEIELQRKEWVWSQAEEWEAIKKEFKGEVEKEFNRLYKGKKWSKGGGDRMSAYYNVRDGYRKKYKEKFSKEAENKTGDEKLKLLFYWRVI